MQPSTKIKLQQEFPEVAKQIRNGAVFIYPTDTIYGLGCNALDEKAVEKVRELKQRPTTPFSIIAPSKEWVSKNCVVGREGKDWLAKLPGPYTLILELKNKNAIAKNVNNNTKNIGVRIPDHWISYLVQELGFPIVTTSANLSGQPHMTSLEDLDESIEQGADFILYEGEKNGRPSKIINLLEGKIKVR